jgi:hypothetical protein
MDREPDGTMFIVAVLIVATILVTIIGFAHEAYLVWYINN